MLKFAIASSADNFKKLIAEFYFCEPEEIELKGTDRLLKTAGNCQQNGRLKKAVGFFINNKRKDSKNENKKI